MTYELWNQVSGNRIEGFEGPAGSARLVQIIREIADLQGLEAVDNLFVEVWTALDDPEPLMTLDGVALRRLAQPRVKTYALEVAAASTKTRTSQSATAQSELALAV